MKNILIYLILIIVIAGGLFMIYSRSKQTTNQQSVSTIQPTTEKLTASVKEFTMTAKQFEFSPSTISVNQGDRVKLNITSLDVTHGFALPDFNINQSLEPNKTVTVEFVADKKGEFTFTCNIPCGPGHRDMVGKIIVN